MANPNQDRLRTHFSAYSESSNHRGWDDLWKEGTFLPWDRGLPNPALVDTLSTRTDILGSPLKPAGARKRALVPGCGKGYDLLLLAAFGYDAYGLEVSENAVKACKSFLGSEAARKEEHEGEYKVRDETVGRGKADVLLADFFQDDFVREIGNLGEGFDLIYDITFLCALPISLRPAWAHRMSQLLAPNGVLLCLEFPTHKPPKSGGPPFAVPSVLYDELLKRPGDEIQYDKELKVVVQDKPQTDKALVQVARWQPERTHQVGVVNGDVKDRVSVWRHK